MATPIYDYIEPWYWNVANGPNATADETYKAYKALVNKESTANFSRKVWNDMVEKTDAVRAVSGKTWDSSVWPKVATQMWPSGILLASMFNSLATNVAYPWYSWQFDPTIESYVGRDYFKGVRDSGIRAADFVYASYLLEVMRALNKIIGIYNGTIERKEINAALRYKLSYSSDLVELRSAPCEAVNGIALYVPDTLDVDEAFPMSFSVEGALTSSSEMSIMLGGLPMVDLLYRLYHISRFHACASVPLLWDCSAASSVTSELVALQPFTDWSIHDLIGTLSISDDLIVRHSAPCELVEIIPDIPCEASLGISSSASALALLRIVFKFITDATVRHGFTMRESIKCCDLTIKAEVSFEIHISLSWQIFITQVMAAALNASTGLPLIHEKLPSYLNTLANLEAGTSSNIAAAMLAYFTNYCTCHRGVAVRLDRLSVEAESNIHADLTPSICPDEEPVVACTSALSLYNLLQYCTANKESFVVSIRIFFGISAALEVSTSFLWDAAIQNSSTIVSSSHLSNSKDIYPVQSIVVCSDSSYAQPDLMRMQVLSAHLLGRFIYAANSELNGSSWLYPIQMFDDLYIRQVVKATQLDTLLQLEQVSVENMLAVEASSSVDSLLDAFSGFVYSCVESTLSFEASMDLAQMWQYPIQRGAELRIPQAISTDITLS